MSLNKAIAAGKEHRKPYYKSALHDNKTCRTGGGCSWCRSNRTHANAVRALKAGKPTVDQDRDG